MSKENKKRASLNQEQRYVKYSVGMDISKKKFDACISVLDSTQRVKVVATRSFDNTAAGHLQFIRWVEQKGKHALPVSFVMEATGVYYEELAWFLDQRKEYVSVVLPNKAKKYIQYLGFKSKNDKIDAKGLAQMGAEQKLDKWKAPSGFVRELRAITRHRERLQSTKTQLNNQLEACRSGAFTNPKIEKSLSELIDNLNKEIKETERLIREHLKSDKKLCQKVENINEIKGVSLITIGTVLAETNCFELFTNSRQLTSYAGYDVVENQSGSHVGKTKISKKGNAHIRRILHLPALSVVRFGEPKFEMLYQRVYERTKIKMKGYVAVQRELLCLMYALWKKEEKYVPNYHRENQLEHPVMQS